jgi:DNA modification methylase
MTESSAMTDPQAWPLEPGSGRGRVHGTSSGSPFDRWFRYPAGFASDYVKLLLDRLDLHDGMLVLDCFMGSGVTGTAAASRGLSFAGIEAHPLIAELASLKLTPLARGADIEIAAAAAATEALARPPASVELGNETELVRRSFNPDALTQLVALREVIKGALSDGTGPYLKWALLGTLRDVAGVKVGWPYQRPAIARTPRHADVTKRFLARSKLIAEDLSRETASDVATFLRTGDAASAETWLNLPAAHGCVTSPPYLNNFDYADATRLELYFWGEVRSWREMCESVRSDMLTATTQQSSKGAKTASLEALVQGYGHVGVEIETLTSAVWRARELKGGRTKEYDQVVPAYFRGIGAVLRNLAENLVPDSTALWLVGDSAPYGVYIDTPAVIGRLAEQVGLEYKEDIRLRHRGQRWGRTERADLSERLIVLHKAG